MKKHRIIKIILLVLLALVLLAVAIGYLVFRPQIKAAASVTKLEDGLYTLTYEGDYGFDAFLAQGGAESDSKMADYIIGFLTHGLYSANESEPDAAEFGCSTLTVRSPEGGVLFGRNYDWEDCDVMLVRTKPENGYASVSTCCLDFIGFGEGWKPEGMANQMMALAAVYVPLDGMNEKGLCIADLMAGDKTATHQQSEKADLTTVSAIRLLLDHAANVEEALALLRDYDMNSSIGSAHHFAISDASGRAVVVEYVENEMLVTETPIVTNHYLTESALQGTGSEQSHLRFDTLTTLLHESGESMDTDALQKSMASVAQSNYPESRGNESTQWTLLCDTDALTLTLYLREQYATPYTYALK